MWRRLGSWFVVGILTLLAMQVDSWGAAKSASKPNIVLVTMDGVRADRIGFLGGHSALTPTLDHLASESIVFLHAYSPSPVSVPAHATILTGTYPQTHHASEFSVPLPAAVPYLPDLLHRAGYATAAFVGVIDLDPRNGPFQGYDRGFDTYDAGFHQPQRGESRYQSVVRRDDEVVARATKWLAANKHRPFFLWVQMGDADGATPAAYDRAVTAMDKAVGKLMTSLHSQSVDRDAMVVVAAAYGQSLGAHNEDSHGIFLYDETIQVPLLVKLPATSAEKQIKSRVRLVDVAPAVLEQAGIAVPSQMQGQSLLRIANSSSQTEQPVYSQTDFPQQGFGCSVIESWRAGKYLYIRAPKPELYDMVADPRATRNLAQTSRATLDTLASQLQAFDARLSNDSGKASSSLSSSEMQKLASLGYVGLQNSSTGVQAASSGTDPKDMIVIANKTIEALNYLDDGKPEKAVPVLKQVLASQSSTYLAQFAMGRALFDQQKYGEAVPYLHKAIELQPDSAWAHYTMGLTLIKTGDFKTAAVHLEIAAGRLPQFPAVHAALAQAYEHLGRTQEAARERAGADRKKNN
jgi:arylsulfatase A-like enzyme/Tfp pilus assembly protein PilF